MKYAGVMFGPKSKKRSPRWLCRCECGKVKTVLHTSLISMCSSQSCGCLHRSSVGHAHARAGLVTPTYRTWCGMLQRCSNPSNPRWKDYGGRGITVCERWLKFDNFLEDMGEKPSGLSIDRKNNNKGYFKSNCRWATQSDQMNNTRRSIFVRWSGARLTVGQWSKLLKLSYPATLEFFDID